MMDDSRGKLMAEENKSEKQASGQSASSSTSSGSGGGPTDAGDPGRTPGAAEGDRETVEQDLQDKQGSQ